MRSLERSKPTVDESIAKASAARRVKDEIKEVSLKDWNNIPPKTDKKKNYWKKSTKYKPCPQRAKKTNDTGWVTEVRQQRKNNKPIPKGVIVHKDGSWDFEDF